MSRLQKQEPLFTSDTSKRRDPSTLEGPDYRNRHIDYQDRYIIMDDAGDADILVTRPRDTLKKTLTYAMLIAGVALVWGLLFGTGPALRCGVIQTLMVLYSVRMPPDRY